MPQFAHNLPFRNIRDVLGLHAKVSPHKPFLVTFDSRHRRHTLTYLEFTGRVHQVANLLYDDLHIKRGDVIAICGGNDENVVLIIMACWIIGATVALLAPDAEADAMLQTLRESQAKLLFAHSGAAKRLKSQLSDTSVMGIVQLDGRTAKDVLSFKKAVANRPTTFLGDDSGAKGADVPIKAGDKRTATLSDGALWLAPDLTLSQYQLLLTANSLAQAQAITGNQQILGVLPLHRVESLVANLLMTLISGATLLLLHMFDAKLFWEIVVNENAHVALVDADILRPLLDFAKSNLASGDTIFGQGIDRRQMKHFRHFLGLHANLNIDLTRDVETTLGVAIISTYGTAHTAGFATILPITLAWDDHQLLLHGMSSLCVGCGLIGCELDVDSANWGENVPLVVNGHPTGDTGYYQQGDDDRAYFFIVAQ